MKTVPPKSWYEQGNSQRFVTLAFVSIAIIAVVDSVFAPYLSLGFLYLIPLCISAAFLSRWQVLIVAAICTAFAEGFSSLPGGLESIIRVVVMFGSYAFATMLVHAIANVARYGSNRCSELERDLVRLHDAENELELMMNSSELGIIAIAHDGRVLHSNRAAHEILGVGFGGLAGRQFTDFFSDSFKQTSADAHQIVLTENGTRLRVWKSQFRNANEPITALFMAKHDGGWQSNSVDIAQPEANR